MKYAFIQRHRHALPVSGQCRALQVSAAGYHAHLVRRAKDETIAWLLWYNEARLHSTLAYVSPMQFERKWLVRQTNL